MKRIAILLLMSACGFSAKENELIGQVKKVVERTPIVCSDYTEADVSLGVLRNGVGSMSKEDVELYVERIEDRATLKHAAETGKLVKVKYDVKRIVLCVPDHWLTSVQIVDDAPAEAKPPG